MYRTIFLTSLLLLSSVALAKGEPGDVLLQPKFRFQQQDQVQGLLDSATWVDKHNSNGAQLNQYNAALSYPLRSERLSVGLGINFRFIEGDVKAAADLDRSYTARTISTAFPMLYATAIFDLPFAGLKASVAGSMMDYEQFRAADYRAKLSYTFNSGIGLQGGWQQQQLNIDGGQEFKAQFENKGPFLDLFYRF
jgi:hypothetical protein